MSRRIAPTAEQEMEEAIANSEFPLVILVGEPFHPGARAMSERVRRAVLANPPAKLLEITLSGHGKWASTREVHGTPAMLVFHGGNEKLRILGALEEETVLELLKKAINP